VDASRFFLEVVGVINFLTAATARVAKLGAGLGGRGGAPDVLEDRLGGSVARGGCDTPTRALFLPKNDEMLVRPLAPAFVGFAPGFVPSRDFAFESCFI
jgi:hypothetical protein